METNKIFARMTKDELSEFWKTVFVPWGDVSTWTDQQFDMVNAWQQAWDKVK